MMTSGNKTTHLESLMNLFLVRKAICLKGCEFSNST